MYLGWLRCLVCLASISAAFQYGDEGPAGNYSIFANRSVKPSPNNCACYDLQGKIYNLAPLQNKDGTASFTVKGKKYPGYSYSYNPCRPFKKGPKDSGCQKDDVAICWYVPNNLPETYKVIGNQRTARCKLTSKKPILVYRSKKNRNSYVYKSTVKLKCDESKKNKDEAIFEILNEDKWEFQLTHLCACGDGCLLYPTEPTTPVITPTPFDRSVLIQVAVSAGTVVVLFAPFLVWWLLRRQNNNNNGNQRRPLLPNGAVEQVHYPIQEEQSQSVPTVSLHGKADVNIRSAPA